MNRRRLRISVRLLMLVVLLAAVWMGRQVDKAREQRELVRAVKAYGGWVHYDWEIANGTLPPATAPPGPVWLRRLMGDEYFQDIDTVNLVYDNSTGRRYGTTNTQPCDQLLARLARLSGLRTLLLTQTQATDNGLSYVGRMTGLRELYIWDAVNISDAGVRQLQGLRNLTYIHITGSKMTDAGLGYLSKLPALEEMALQQNRFTDAGLAHVKHMTQLKSLWVGLGKGSITDAGVAQLRGHERLELLDIQQSQVSDQGLEHLKTLVRLKEICGSGSRITKEGAERFKAARPNVIAVSTR